MRYSGRADAISMGLSIVCLMHCIFLPLFLTSLPFLGIEILENMYLELATILLSLIVGGYAIRNGYLKFHRNLFIVLVFVAGISLMMLSNFLFSSAEIWLKLSGGFIICVAHIQNFTNSKKCTLNINENCGTGFVNNFNS
jgi:hypothetical protein